MSEIERRQRICAEKKEGILRKNFSLFPRIILKLHNYLRGKPHLIHVQLLVLAIGRHLAITYFDHHCKWEHKVRHETYSRLQRNEEKGTCYHCHMYIWQRKARVIIVICTYDNEHTIQHTLSPLITRESFPSREILMVWVVSTVFFRKEECNACQKKKFSVTISKSSSKTAG